MKYHTDGVGLLPKDTYKQIGWINLDTEEIVHSQKAIIIIIYKRFLMMEKNL